MGDPFDQHYGFKLAFEQAPIGISICDRDFQFLWVNDAYCELLEYTRDELLSLKFTDVTHEEDLELDLASARQLFDGHLEHYSIEKRYVTKSGRHKWIKLVATTLVGPKGTTYGLAMVEDITERRKREEDRRKSELVELHEDFIAMLNHDLKNPLVGANRILELLSEGKLGQLSDQQRQLLTQLLDSNRTVLATIYQLVEVYRYQVEPANFSETDLKNDLSQCLSRFEREARERGVKLERVFPDTPVTLKADSDGLRRVFENLVENALKFTPEGGMVIVSLKRSDTEAIVTISDTGSGIDEQQQEVLFKRFWKGSSGHYAPGTWLGLFACRQIVEAHSGQIKCQSEPGSGSTFTVRLPLKPSLSVYSSHGAKVSDRAKE